MRYLGKNWKKRPSIAPPLPPLTSYRQRLLKCCSKRFSLQFCQFFSLFAIFQPSLTGYMLLTHKAQCKVHCLLCCEEICCYRLLERVVRCRSCLGTFAKFAGKRMSKHFFWLQKEVPYKMILMCQKVQILNMSQQR